MEWPNYVIFEFLKLYKVEPTLWNTRSAEHKNQKDLYDAWYRIKSKLMDGKVPIKEIKKKRDNLMATYRKARSKVINSITAGKTGSNVYKPDWPFYKVMSKFLDDVYNPRKIKNAEGGPQKTSNPQHKKKKLEPKLTDAQRRKTTHEKNNESLDTTTEPVSTVEDDCDAFCTNLKVQMRYLEVEQKYICQKLISDAIFLARTCQLNLTSRIHTEISQLRVADSIPSTSSTSFKKEISTDSSSFKNERLQMPLSVQRNISVPPGEGFLYMDPLHQGYGEALDEEQQDSDSELDTKEGIIGNL